ncbi:MAG: hypothetical protein ABIB71_00540 [Candidatus Woesearchaeota archaeon]
MEDKHKKIGIPFWLIQHEDFGIEAIIAPSLFEGKGKCFERYGDLTQLAVGEFIAEFDPARLTVTAYIYKGDRIDKLPLDLEKEVIERLFKPYAKVEIEVLKYADQEQGEFPAYDAEKAGMIRGKLEDMLASSGLADEKARSLAESYMQLRQKVLATRKIVEDDSDSGDIVSPGLLGVPTSALKIGDTDYMTAVAMLSEDKPHLAGMLYAKAGRDKDAKRMIGRILEKKEQLAPVATIYSFMEKDKQYQQELIKKIRGIKSEETEYTARAIEGM